MNNHKWDARSLTRHNSGVILAMIFAVGLPLSLIQACLFGPPERVSSFILDRRALGADALTALTMAAFCMSLALGMLLGHWFLRRFLR